MKSEFFALSAAVLAALFLSACGEQAVPQAGHDSHATAAPEHGGEHAADGEKITHFGDQSELYVEFPRLVVGQPASFVAHFTWLADFKPLDRGRLTLVLAGGGGAEERVTMAAPDVPGIFKPVLTPQTAGQRELTLIVESDRGTLTHQLGTVAVFADARAAQAEHDEHGHGAGGIPFSKEQQWKIDFATVAAVTGVARESVRATGTVRATPDGEALIAAPVAGLLHPAGRFVRVGQAVRKGQVLATLAPRLGGETDHASLAAAAGKAQVVLEQARRERERMERLYQDEAVAEKRLLEAVANERIAASEEAAARQRLGQLGGSGGIALRAPIDGVIADVSVAPGAFVAEGAQLLHIADTARLWLEARVPESDIGRLGQPSGAWFAVDGYAAGFDLEAGRNARLIAVGGVVDAATRTVPVIFEFANPGRALRLGMTAQVHVRSGGGRAGVLVPAAAVQDESGAQVVYVQSSGESFERRLVQAGTRDGARIEIKSGVQAGERVVTQGAYLIRLSTSRAEHTGHAH